MTTTAPEVQPLAQRAPRLAFMAALAVVSRGRALAPGQLAAFAAALDRLEAPAAVRAEVLEAGERGLRAVEVADDEALALPDAIALLASLVLFALRAGDEPDEALFVPEHLASGRRLPADAIPRLVGRLGPQAAEARFDDLAAHLHAYLHPGDFELDAARWLHATLEPARPDKRRFGHVARDRFQHPLDRQAMDLTAGIAGFEDLTRLIFEHGFEKAFRLINLSSAIRVGPDQFPDLWRVWQDCVARAGVDPSIELYVGAGGINAHTSGIERPYVMLNSGAVGALTRDELEFIIGHELGHIRCEHMLHLFMIQFLPFVAGVVPVVGQLLQFALRAALGEWRRKAELSCDRVGLLTCQDPEAAVRTMMKWSGAPGVYYQRLDQQAFLRQAEEFRALDSDMLSMIYKLLMTMNLSHPWTVERAAELVQWAGSGAYDQVFAGPEPAGGPVAQLPAGPPPVRPATADEADRDQPLAHRVATRLGRIARAADALGAGVGATALVDALAEREAGSLPEIVVVGEKGRGKTTVARHLTARLGDLAALVDTPGLNDADAGFEEGVMAAVLRADAVLVCLSAAQLLSTEERRSLRERILPIAPGRVALVVTHCDALESDADRADLASRLGRFVGGSDQLTMEIFHVSDGELPEGLVAFATAAAQAARQEEAGGWAARVGALLDALGRAAEGMPEDAGEWRPPGEPEKAAMRDAIAREHGLALTAAEAHLTGRIAELRQGVPARVAGYAPAALAREGLAAITGDVQRVAREAAGVYLAAFERGMVARAGLPEHAQVRPEGEGLDGSLRGPDGMRLGTRRPADLVTMGLTAAGAGIALFGGSVVTLLVGGVAIAAAHGLRVQADEAFRARLRDDATAAIDGWLVGAEGEIAARLREAAEPVKASLLDRAAAAFDRPPPLEAGIPSVGALREAIAACRALLDARA